MVEREGGLVSWGSGRNWLRSVFCRVAAILVGCGICSGVSFRLQDYHAGGREWGAWQAGMVEIKEMPVESFRDPFYRPT